MEALLLFRFAGERLDHIEGGHLLLEVALHRFGLVLDPPAGGLDALFQQAGHGDIRGKDRQGYQRERYADAQQHVQQHEYNHSVDPDIGQRVADQVLGLADIVDQARHDAARLARMVVGGAHALDVEVQIISQVEYRLIGGFCRGIMPEEGHRDVYEQVQAHHEQDRVDDGAPFEFQRHHGIGIEHVVHEIPQYLRKHQRHGELDHPAQGGQQDEVPVWFHIT